MMKRYEAMMTYAEYTGEPEATMSQDEHGEYVKAEVARVLYDTLIQTRKIICEGVETGFNPEDGDWAERLFSNNAYIAKALSLADGNGDE